MIGFLVGLWRAEMALNEKGYYFTVLMYGLFSVVSVQKSVRDRLEGVPVTDIYYGLSWFSTILCIVLLTIGFFDALSNVFFAVASTKGVLPVVAVGGSMYPAFTIALAHGVLGERLARIQWAGVVLALLGVALIAAGS